MTRRVAVFASGGGTNLQALLDRFGADGDPDGIARIALVISDREGAGALDRARRAGVPAKVVAPARAAEAARTAEPASTAGAEALDVDPYDRALLDALREAEIDLVVLAGFIRLVPATVVRAYRDRILNIHPSLLPAFGGKGMYGARVHRAVLEAGCRVTGATVHRVDERYDTGPILAQWPVPVLPGDSPETLAGRVLRIEHRLLPAAVELVARGIGGADRTGPVGLVEPIAFRTSSAEAPSEDEVRRALGLEPVSGRASRNAPNDDVAVRTPTS